MGERDALLRAVCENPDDDLPRLVFADWLDENGEPERAEFIRVQCTLARSSLIDPLLKERERVLLAEHERRWREPFSKFGRADEGNVQFRRGFVYGLEIEDEEAEFADYAEELFCLAPIQRISFMLAWDHTRLAGCKEIIRLRELGVDRCGFEADTLAVLFESPYLTSLNRLELVADDDNGHMDEEGLRLLGECANMPALRELDLSGNWCNWQWRDEGWVANLIAGNLVAQLDQLCLSGMFMADRGAEVLANSSRLQRLTRLDLSRNMFTGRGMLSLARSPNFIALKTIDLRDNYYSADEDDAVSPEAARADLIERFGTGVLLDGDRD